VIADEALPGAASACRIVPSALGEALGDVAALAVARHGLEQEGLWTVPPKTKEVFKR
jgi:hypothetical protein